MCCVCMYVFIRIYCMDMCMYVFMCMDMCVYVNVCMYVIESGVR
jgi:hypothetical protein